ncbi:MAG TPA: hypothetical protein VK543_10340 [Puia sp.]|nr:hypothetical protein [Puia sp.]
MYLNYFPGKLLNLCAGLLLCIGCVKTNPPTNNNNNNAGSGSNGSNLPPAVTPIGTPVGTAVTQTIGPSGGLIISDDGNVFLTIPAGALSANTDITIQPVTNETPGGIGNSYHLMPDGTKFSKPAGLTFMYTDEELNGSHPYLLFIAYQDNLNEWIADLKDRWVDTLSKTVSMEINHFSIWSRGESMSLEADKEKLYAGENTELRLVMTGPGQLVSTGPDASDDELSTLSSKTPLDGKKVKNWKVNDVPGGNDHDGLINDETLLGKTADKAVYNAPRSVDRNRTVVVSVEYNDPVTLWNKGKPSIQLSKFIFLKELQLFPKPLKYALEITFYQTFPDKTILMDTTEVELGVDLTLNNLENAVTVTSVAEHAPALENASHDQGGCSFSWIKDDIGMLNIDRIEGFVSFNIQSGDMQLDISIYESNMHNVGSNTTCPNAPPTNIPPPLYKGDGKYNFAVDGFVLNDQEQDLPYAPNDLAGAEFKLHLKPLK